LRVAPDTSIGVSGRHDFAVRFLHAFVFRIESVHRIPHPTFVTIAKRPSVQEHGTAQLMDLIWVRREGKYFCSSGWTGSISLIGFDKFDVWRKGALRQTSKPTVQAKRRRLLSPGKLAFDLCQSAPVQNDPGRATAFNGRAEHE
jgi:hypothetical protein